MTSRMKEKTRYNYENRIRELQDEVNDLRKYKNIAINIFDGVVEVADTNNSISLKWVLGKFRQVLPRIYS